MTLRYVLSHFNYGQVNLLILALLVFGCALLFKGRSISGGLLIGVSMVIKPFALPFLVWFAASRQWRALIGAFAAGLAVLALPAKHSPHNPRASVRDIDGKTDWVLRYSHVCCFWLLMWFAVLRHYPLSAKWRLTLGGSI